MPPTDVVRPSNAPIAKSSTRENTYTAQDRASIDPTPIDDDLEKNEATTPPRALNWEEMVEMLKQIPHFTEVEPFSTKMSDFFSLMKWISVNL